MTPTVYDHVVDATQETPRLSRRRAKIARLSTDETGDLKRSAVEDMEWDRPLRDSPRWRTDVWDNPRILRKHHSDVLRRDRRWIGYILWFCAFLVVAGLIVGGLVGNWVIRQVNPPGAPGAPVSFTVNDTDTLTTVSHRLKDQNIITHAGVFQWYVARKGGLKLTPGYYQIKPHDTMGNVLSRLRTSPEQTFTKVTFPEGLTLQDMSKRLVAKVPRLSADSFLSVTANGTVSSSLLPAGVTNLEGLLFPDTYQISNGESEAQVAKRMVAQMERVGRQVGIEKAPAKFLLTPYQVLIVASIIEKEAKTAVDRPLIARVIYNRLAAGIPLQIDATLLYNQDPKSKIAPLKAIDTPYNGYLHAGLPPTPISNPGKASIVAAMNPADNPNPTDDICKNLPKNTPCEYRFYVLHDRSSHVFAVTQQQQDFNVAYAAAHGLLTN
jgi:UPF0755 protein